MSECKTVDELIANLEKIKARLGGKARVLLTRGPKDNAYPFVSAGRVGKSDERRFVSRGGVFVVVIS